jgi:hypothetical protein
MQENAETGHGAEYDEREEEVIDVRESAIPVTTC